MRGSPGAICPLVGGGPIDFDWARHVEVGVWWQKKGLEEPSPRVLGARAFRRGAVVLRVWQFGGAVPSPYFFSTLLALRSYYSTTPHAIFVGRDAGL